MPRRMLPVPFLTLGRDVQDAENRLRRLLGPDFGFNTLPMNEPVGWVPNVQIVESDAELLLTAELPGLQKNDVELAIENEVLTIRGEKREEKKEEKNGDQRYLVWERTYGEFVRTFTLPRSIDTAKISAEMKDGVLKIHLPKGGDPKARGHKIEIMNQ
jgi:HSP20 family protein